MSEAPVVVSESLNLSSHGISAENIRFGHLTLQSDQFVCCKGTDGAKNVLNVVDLRDMSSIKQDKFPMNGDSAIMHPTKKWLALRGGRSLQVFDAEQRQKVASHKLDEGVTIVFWTWISPSLIGLVTDSAVFHWNIDSPDQLEKVFERHASLEGCQITNYAASNDSKWMLLSGIAKGDSPGIINGKSQLYSIEKGVSQPLQSHAGTFASITPEGETTPREMLCFVEKKENLPSKLFIMEVTTSKAPKTAGSGPLKLPPRVISYPEGVDPSTSLSDFPVSVVFSPKQGILYIVTRQGFLFMYDAFSSKPLSGRKVTSDAIFATALDSQTNGLLAITTKRGPVLRMALNPKGIIPHLLRSPDNANFAINIAKRLNLPGAEQLFVHAFNSALLKSPTEAATIAATSPNGLLRTRETLDRLRSAPNAPANVAFLYFKAVMDNDMLNKWESIELAKLVLSQKKVTTIERMIKEQKILCCEELGDILMQSKGLVGPEDKELVTKLALAVYYKSTSSTENGSSDDCHRKVIQCFVELGQIEKVIPYADKMGYSPDYNVILQSVLKSNPKAGEQFAKQLASAKPPLLDVGFAVDLFLQYSLLEEATSFLLEVLKDDLPQQGALQTKLLEINLVNNNASVVTAILSNDMFHHFDKKYIASLLEKHHHFKRALDIYTDIADIKRVLKKYVTKLYTSSSALGGAAEKVDVKPEEDYIVKLCGKFAVDTLYTILETMLEVYEDLQQAGVLGLVVEVCVAHVDLLDTDKVLTFLEKHTSASIGASKEANEAVFFFTSKLVNTSKNKSIVYKFIETGAALEQFDAIIRVIKDNELVKLNKDRVKNLLLLSPISDPRPFIHLCDRFDFTDELVNYLVTKDLLQHLEIYVEKVNPRKSSVVIAKLLDLDCNDLVDKILKFESVKDKIDYGHLVDVLEQRNKLPVVKAMLEEKLAKEDGNSTNEVVHNAVAKMKILTNESPAEVKKFLETDDGYNLEVIGAFCEKIDPKLAYICYSRARNDALLVKLCMVNEMFEVLAMECFKRQDKSLWNLVLSTKPGTSSSNDSSLSALSSTSTTEIPSQELVHTDELGAASFQVSAAQREEFLHIATSPAVLGQLAKSMESLSPFIKALLTAEATAHLLQLLEHVLLNPQFEFFSAEGKTQSLENLLLITAVKAKPENVMGYVKQRKLSKYDSEAISKICISSEMYPEAIEIYKRFKKFDSAVKVMLLMSKSGQQNIDFSALESSVRDLFVEAGDQISQEQKSTVLSTLAKHLLESETTSPGSNISKAVALYIEAENPEDNTQVMKKCYELNLYSDLIDYLLMCRRTLKEKVIDTGLVYCFCKSKDKTQLQTFLLAPNLAQVDKVAERLYGQARDIDRSTSDSEWLDTMQFCLVLYDYQNNYSKLCEIHTSTNNFEKALEAARKANQVSLWKSVNSACLEAGKVELAHVAGLSVVSNPLYLEDVVSLYEHGGWFVELLKLLRSAIQLENAHNALFTQLAVSLATYGEFVNQQDKSSEKASSELVDLVKRNGKRMNVSKVVRTCEKEMLYAEMVEILILMGESEQAVGALLKHSEYVFTHEKLLQVVSAQSDSNDKTYIRNEEVYYNLLNHYIEFDPLQVSSMLIGLHKNHVPSKSPAINCSRVVKTLAKFDHLPLLKEFFTFIQEESLHTVDSKKKKSTSTSAIEQYDLAVVNETVNALLVEEDDLEGLHESVDKHPNFDQLALARSLQTHSFSGFRQMSAKLFFKKKFFAEALAICEADDEYEVCLGYAESSRSKQVCEDLLEKFFTKGKKSYFFALVALCGDYVSSDLVLSLAWRKDWIKETMPFMISSLKTANGKIATLESQVAELMQDKKKEKEEEKNNSSLLKNGMGKGPMLMNTAQHF